LNNISQNFQNGNGKKNISQIPDLVIDFKKELYQDLVQEFTQYLK